MLTVFVEDRIKCNGCLQIHEKIIPFGTVWERTWGVYQKGDLYKSDNYMPEGIKGITIHNTDYISDSVINSRQYALSTWLQNMGDARVHYYICKDQCWQLLEDNEVGWHAGTGGWGAGNIDTISIEIIMKNEDDIKAMHRGAYLTAYLLKKYNLPVSAIYTHKHWNGKQCPIFLLPQWEHFITVVERYLNMDFTECEGIKRYKRISDIADNEFYAPTINKLVDKGILKGRNPDTDDLEIDLSEDAVRVLVVLDRAGMFD